jgi:hypothetical protein
MDPLTDFDRALRDAMQVEPNGNFTARIRTRVATTPRVSPSIISRFAIAAMTCALLAIVAAGIWRETPPFAAKSVLPHRDLVVLSEPPRAVSSPPSQLPPQGRHSEVIVSRSEMLALQQLFSGTIVAPPPLLPPANELAIPELAIAPLSTSTTEGERQ